MTTKADFYFISTEMRDKTVRTCWQLGELVDVLGQKFMLIKIELPIVGQQYGLGGDDIDKVLIKERYVDDNLFPINRWPLTVNMFRMINVSYSLTDILNENDYRHIDIGKIFRSSREMERK